MPSDPVDADLVRGLSAWVHDACRGFDASHDAEHAAQVHRLSELVLAADLPFASRDVQQAVRCAAWTHDLCDRKYVSDVPAAAAHVASTCRDLGASAAAAKLAGTVVATMSFSARLRRFDAAVAHAGSADARSTEWGDPPGMTEVELAVYRVVSDADLLEAMGTVGVVRTFMYQATTTRPHFPLFCTPRVHCSAARAFCSIHGLAPKGCGATPSCRRCAPSTAVSAARRRWLGLREPDELRRPTTIAALSAHMLF